jgi:RND family efflux transporter MFP subunit
MYAPTSGRIGRRQQDVGNLVGSGQSTLLATIVQLDPIYVYFSVSERDLTRVLAQRGTGALTVTVALAGRPDHPEPGRVDFVNNSVDPTTGTFQVRATVPNRERGLLPGQYAQVRLHMGNRLDSILVPEQALMEEQGGQSVLVVGADRKVERRSVVTGPTFEGQRVIERGLEAGEEVVIDGLQKAPPGAVVNPTR